MRLELVPLAVADPDAAKAWYVDRVGFEITGDVTPQQGMRVVQLTPPGRPGCCSSSWRAPERHLH